MIVLSDPFITMLRRLAKHEKRTLPEEAQVFVKIESTREDGEEKEEKEEENNDAEFDSDNDDDNDKESIFEIFRFHQSPLH